MAPRMVSLAKKLKNRPFHLVASHSQRFGDKESALKLLKSAKWREEMTNVSLVGYGYAPKGIEHRYVPFYLLFDHTGKLRYYHQAGPYHGGNDDSFKTEVYRLLKELEGSDSAKDNRSGGSKGSDKLMSSEREWKNKEGITMRASLVRVTGTNAVFQKSNGTEYTFDIAKLSDADQKFIHAAMVKDE